MKQKNHKKEFNKKSMILIGGVIIVLIGLLLYQTAVINKMKDEGIIIDTKVGDFKTTDIRISVYVNGERQSVFPAKSSGKKFEKLVCTNSGYGVWDEINWKISINDVSGETDCSIYFE